MHFYIILEKGQGMKMVYYEIKKILCRTSSKIAVVFLAVFLIITCYSTVFSIHYTNENGNTEKGITAIHKLRKAKKEWSGELTEEKITAVIKENNRINQTEEAQSKNTQKQNIAYNWKQGFDDIRTLLIKSFCKFREYDYYLPDLLKPEDASKFYDNRITHLQQWLDGEAKNWYNQKEKTFLLTQYNTLNVPMYYDFVDGWDNMFESIPKIIMITVLVLGFLLSSIFTREKQLKAESIFYSSYYGRNKAIYAKLKAGFLLTTGIYWAMMLLSSLIVLGIIGWDGANCVIQIKISGWISIYHLTFIQEYLLILFGGYIGTLFFAFFTMLVSAKTKSAVFAVMMPFILIFIPSFLSENTTPIISKIIGLLPDQLLQINKIVSMFHLYQIGGKIIGSIPILFVIYAAAFLVLYPLTYQIYKKSDVK